MPKRFMLINKMLLSNLVFVYGGIAQVVQSSQVGSCIDRVQSNATLCDYRTNAS